MIFILIFTNSLTITINVPKSFHDPINHTSYYPFSLQSQNPLKKTFNLHAPKLSYPSLSQFSNVYHPPSFPLPLTSINQLILDLQPNLSKTQP